MGNFLWYKKTMGIIFAEYEVRIIFKDALKCPTFFGSTIRGGFGYIFRKSVCITGQKTCENCILLEKCPYAYIFETGILTERGIKNVPHPFVFNITQPARGKFSPGDEFSFGITLLGRGVEFFPYFLFALVLLGENGIGKERARFEIKEILKDGKVVFDGKKLYPGWDTPSQIRPVNINGKITLEFVTPTKIIYRGKLVEVPSFHALVKSLNRRLRLLDTYHRLGYSGISSEFVKQAEKIEVMSYFFEKVRKKRFSTRQKRTMEFHGFVGRVTYAGDLTPYIEILNAGEIVHVGKATAFGFGRFKLATE